MPPRKSAAKSKSKSRASAKASNKTQVTVNVNSQNNRRRNTRGLGPFGGAGAGGLRAIPFGGSSVVVNNAFPSDMVNVSSTTSAMLEC